MKTWKDYSLRGSETQRAIALGLADAEWYRSPVPREKMRELLVRKNGPAIRDTIIWFGLIFGSGYLVYLWWGSWFVVFPYIVYSVLYASTSDSRWHESSHGTAFRTDWMNNLLYEISSFMVLRQSTVWRWSHTRHHSDTIIRGRDPEIAVPRPPNFIKIILTFFGISAAVPEIKKIIKHAGGRIDPEVATYVPAHEFGKVILKARIYVLIFLAVIALSVIYGTLLPLMYVGFSTLLGTWLMPVYGFTQHAGLQENVLDHRLNCRTVYMNRIHRFLYWNMNYHVEHHMFPLVPYHALPKLHELMKDDCPKPYSGIIEAYREIIPALLRQHKDPTYFVVRQLPETAASGEMHPKKIFTGDRDKINEGRIEVCSLTDLPPGEVVRFDFEQKTYAVYRTSEDQFYATDGICTHGNAHLGDGVIIGDMIECPKHNGRFSLKDGSPRRDPVCVGINTYAVDTAGGMIYLSPSPVNKAAVAREFSYRVESNRNLTPFVKELVLMPAGTGEFAYSAGQYVQLVIPPHQTRFDGFEVDEPFREVWESHGLFDCYSENGLFLKRNYSMATNPASGSLLKFNVRIALPPEGMDVPAGAGSSWVFGLKPGDSVKFSGPHGDFRIRQSDREMIYVGGGAGMAPLRSHLSYLFETERTGRKISFWYGARTSGDLYYRDYFENLQIEHENFSFHIALSDPVPGDEQPGHKGMVHEVLYREYLSDHVNPAGADYYLCGPPAMIRAALEMLEKLGVPQEQISRDEF